jgi:GAF domain-containing protein
LPAMTVLDDTAGDLKRENAELQRRLAERDSDVAELQRRLAEREAELAEAQGRLAERDSEFAEAIAQQAASSEVLQVINSSSGDLAPVFDAILEKALRLCEADFGTLFIRDGDQFRGVATRNLPPALAVFVQAPFEPSATGFFKRAAKGQDVAHIPDLSIATAHISGDPRGRALVELGGARTLLAAALRNNDTVLGAFSIYRTEVRPFADEQIALLKNFAAQAVIAMENARLITETREALAQQTATAEVLGVINSSPGNLTPVFDAILDKGLYLCEAAFGTLWTFDGECFHAVALHRVPAGFAEVLTRAPYRPEPGSGHESLLRGASYFQLHDAGAELSVGPVRRALVELGGARTVIAVPLRKEGTILGAISAYRQEVRSFTDKQIALLQNFAAQAVIAMENARLITETREALEQQTATAEVLGVINASPGDLAPVFDTMLEKATRLCDADFGILWNFEGELAKAGALHRVPEAYANMVRAPFRPSPESGPARMMRGESTFVVPDLRAYPPYEAGDALVRAIVDLAGARSVVITPLRKDGITVGAITIYRQETHPFTERQIALLENFAAQAVIAMENARLITETREALEQQTATAEVLGVINSSPGDLAPVFQAMLEKALRLCDAAFGHLMIYDGECFSPAAAVGEQRAVEWLRERGSARPGPSTTMERIRQGEHLIHIADAADDDTYRQGEPSRRAMVEIAGVRTLLSVALRKDDALLGAISVYRQEVRPFTNKQIALLQNFAAQAVVAMENARLITETREALEQQTATAEVLGVINSSPGDLARVFDAILEKAHALCGIAFGSLQLYEQGKVRAVAVRAIAEDLAELLRQPMEPRPGSSLSRLVAGERFVHNTDILN